MAKNTFKLRNPKEYIYIPSNGEVITKDSTDDMVMTYLNEVKGAERQKRIDRFFLEIPKVEKKKATPKKKPVDGKK